MFTGVNRNPIASGLTCLQYLIPRLLVVGRCSGPLLSGFAADGLRKVRFMSSRIPLLLSTAFLAGPDPAAGAGPVLPQLSGSVYVFAFPGGGPRLEVDPAAGARIGCP